MTSTRGTGPFFRTDRPAGRAIILSSVPQSKSKRSRYTPPPPKKAPPSPLWFGVAISTMLAVGLVVIITNYIGLLPGEAENRYLIIGLVLISTGFMMATGYH